MKKVLETNLRVILHPIDLPKHISGTDKTGDEYQIEFEMLDGEALEWLCRKFKKDLYAKAGGE